MRTSIDDIKKAEEFHFGKMNTEDRLLFEARTILSPTLRLNAAIQAKLYGLIRSYGRKKLRHELNDIHHQLLSSPQHKVFQTSIDNIFKK